MQRHPADHLHIIMTQADRPFGGFTHHRKRFGQDLIQNILFKFIAVSFIFAIQPRRLALQSS